MSQSKQRAICVFAWLAVSLSWTALAGGRAGTVVSDSARPLSPIEAQRTFRLPADLAIELVAAEPDVIDPVAVAWDERGRMYVVEMGDYPTGPPGGRIKTLHDRDGDGRVDTSHVFADGLPFPTSVLPWRGGVFVSAAPNILYLKDTDDDGVADQRIEVLTGFAEGNQQLRVNGLLWGVDGWIYGANGRSDGEIRVSQPPPSGSPPKRVSQTGASRPAAVSIRHRDFRFNPLTVRVEPVSSFTQHGHGFDDWGNRFIGWNTIHIRHVFVDQRYLERNPHVPAFSSVEEISDHGSAARIFPLSKTTQRFNAEPPGFVNASCGLTIYRGDLLAEEYRGNAFVCEPLSNLVHRDLLEPAGATFIARRASTEKDCEFLASSDAWFRPVNLATGPDGALYVIDFYRALVEHPAYVRDEQARKTVDWYEGRDRGRIWRIVSKGSTPRPWPNYQGAHAPDLVRLLEHPNGWDRDTAHRLLVEREARDVVPSVEELALESSHPSARVHALWILETVGALDDTVLFRALGDGHPRVREHAIRLSEPRLARSHKLTGLVTDLADDPDSRVRFQVACTLGGTKASSESVAALYRMLRQGADKDRVRRAILLATPNVTGELLRAWLDEMSGEAEPAENESSLLFDLASVLGDWNKAASIDESLRAAAGIEGKYADLWRITLLAGIAEGRRRGAGDGDVATPLHRRESFSPGARETMARILGRADEVMFNESIPGHTRMLAVQLAAYGEPTAALHNLSRVLRDARDASLATSAIRALGNLRSVEVAPVVLDSWARMTPSVRRVALDVLISRRDLAMHVVSAVQNGQIAATELDTAAVDRLVRVIEAGERDAIRALFSKARGTDRKKVLETFRPALALAGARSNGAALFTKHCMTCHAIQNKGNRIGPDLASVTGRSREELLGDIIDPSRAYQPDAATFLVVTRDGRVLSGLIAGESAQRVTLRRADGSEESVQRSDIEELRATGKSFMPEGLEQLMTHQEMADLLEFLRAGEPPP